VIPWCHSGKVENTIQKSDQVGLTYVEMVTIAKVALKGTDQIPPFEFAGRRRGSSVQLKKKAWLMAANATGRFGSDRASINHPFDGGPMSTMSKVVQDRVEEM